MMGGHMEAVLTSGWDAFVVYSCHFFAEFGCIQRIIGKVLKCTEEKVYRRVRDVRAPGYGERDEDRNHVFDGTHRLEFTA